MGDLKPDPNPENYPGNDLAVVLTVVIIVAIARVTMGLVLVWPRRSIYTTLPLWNKVLKVIMRMVLWDLVP